MITRAQIRRQLRKDGGIMNVTPRQGYFLGKVVKAITKPFKKVVDVGKQVIKSPIGKAAILGLGGAGLMGMGPLGSTLSGFGARMGGSGIGQFFKGMGPKLFGQTPFLSKTAAMKGAAGFPGTSGILGKLGLTKGGGSLMPTALGGITAASLMTYFMSKGKPEEEAIKLAEDVKRGEGLGLDLIKADIKKYRSGALSGSQMFDKGYNFLLPREYIGAKGGRVGLANGSEGVKQMYMSDEAGVIPKKGNRGITKEDVGLKRTDFDSDENYKRYLRQTNKKAQGGRIGFANGPYDISQYEASGQYSPGDLEFLSRTQIPTTAPEWYAEEVEKQRQHWDPTWGPFLMPESWEEVEEPAKVHMMRELGPYYEREFTNPNAQMMPLVEPTPTTGRGAGFSGFFKSIKPAVTSAETAETAPSSISMGNTLQQNIAANEAQQMRNQQVLQAARARLPGMNKAQGGRIGYEDGTPKIPENLPTDTYLEQLEDFLRRRKKYEDRIMRAPTQEAAQGGRIGYADGTEDGAIKKTYNKVIQRKIKMLQGMKDSGIEISAEDDKWLQEHTGHARGGRINKYGGGVMAAMPRIPTGIPTGMPRVNAGGVSEIDYRQEGGFVPVGVKEKADDVPAMLSKNEFVMTADAVKGAGGGNVEKGAQKMYDTMKRLETRIA